MIVCLVAHTVVHPDALKEAGWIPSAEQKTYALDDTDTLAEFAGRLCYQSWSRPNPSTSRNTDYLANIIGQQHFSVLEHASASFYVAEVSRSLLAEITRHRHLSFSVLSQRYVDESEAEVIVPPILKGSPPHLDLQENLSQLTVEARSHYRTIFSALMSLGVSRKQAREAARCVLPNATETKFIVTGNMRAWRDVLSKRLPRHADAEIQLLATEILRQLQEIAPNTFQDMK